MSLGGPDKVAWLLSLGCLSMSALRTGNIERLHGKGEQGFSRTDIEVLRSIFEVYPSVNDLLSSLSLPNNVMSSQRVAWDRFVRYVPQGADQTIRYGDPIISSSQVNSIAQLAEEGNLEVKILEGNDPLGATPTGKTEKVARLLGPLEPANVPIIRCIGLNYKTHSMLPICLG